MSFLEEYNKEYSKLQTECKSLTEFNLLMQIKRREICDKYKDYSAVSIWKMTHNMRKWRNW